MKAINLFLVKHQAPYMIDKFGLDQKGAQTWLS